MGFRYQRLTLLLFLYICFRGTVGNRYTTLRIQDRDLDGMEMNGLATAHVPVPYRYLPPNRVPPFFLFPLSSS